MLWFYARIFILIPLRWSTFIRHSIYKPVDTPVKWLSYTVWQQLSVDQMSKNSSSCVHGLPLLFWSNINKSWTIQYIVKEIKEIFIIFFDALYLVLCLHVTQRIMAPNLSEVCRLCLQSYKLTLDIFTSYYVKRNMSYADMISSCTKLKVGTLYYS